MPSLLLEFNVLVWPKEYGFKKVWVSYLLAVYSWFVLLWEWFLRADWCLTSGDGSFKGGRRLAPGTWRLAVCDLFSIGLKLWSRAVEEQLTDDSKLEWLRYWALVFSAELLDKSRFGMLTLPLPEAALMCSGELFLLLISMLRCTLSSQFESNSRCD